MQIGAADTTGADVQSQLAGGSLGVRQLEPPQWLALFLQDGGAHHR
jgi:hypothetical protein